MATADISYSGNGVVRGGGGGGGGCGWGGGGGGWLLSESQ